MIKTSFTQVTAWANDGNSSELLTSYVSGWAARLWGLYTAQSFLSLCSRTNMRVTVDVVLRVGV